MWPRLLIPVIRRTNPLLKAMYAPDDSVQGMSTMQDLFFGRMTTFVCMLIQTLNYPWVSYDPVMWLCLARRAPCLHLSLTIVITGQRSCCPRIITRCVRSTHRASLSMPSDCIRFVDIGGYTATRMAHSADGHGLPQHTRGNVKLGVVLKDYQLAYEEDQS